MRLAGQGLRSYMLDNLIRTGGTKAAEEVVKKTALAGIAAITLPMTVFNAAQRPSMASSSVPRPRHTRLVSSLPKRCGTRSRATDRWF